jgi:hypothetical protein
MKEAQTLYETLKIIRKATEDDPELRASDDHAVWGVKLIGDNPAKPTYAIYAGPEAKDYACDLADYEVDEDEEEEDDDDGEDD